MGEHDRAGDDRNLLYDKRLARRRGWIGPDELSCYLKALPDVGEKAETVSEELDDSIQENS